MIKQTRVHRGCAEPAQEIINKLAGIAPERRLRDMLSRRQIQ